MQTKAAICQQLDQLLARRDYGVEEITRILSSKGACQQLLEPIIAEYECKGWIDDKRYAQRLIDSYHNRGYGRHYIRRKCQLRYLDAAIVAELLATLETCWLEQAVALLHKRVTGRLTPKEQQKQKRFLLSRGFTQEESVQAIQEFHA